VHWVQKTILLSSEKKKAASRSSKPSLACRHSIAGLAAAMLAPAQRDVHTRTAGRAAVEVTTDRVTNKQAISFQTRMSCTPTTRDRAWAGEAVPFQLLLRDAAHPHSHGVEQVRVRTRLGRGREGVAVAAAADDGKRVVGRRHDEQGRRQCARRQPRSGGRGRRRRRHAVPVPNGALQNRIRCNSFHSTIY
jgi:hypothetical protein